MYGIHFPAGLLASAERFKPGPIDSPEYDIPVELDVEYPDDWILEEITKRSFDSILIFRNLVAGLDLTNPALRDNYDELVAQYPWAKPGTQLRFPNMSRGKERRIQ
jgi:hypothetical protein